MQGRYPQATSCLEPLALSLALAVALAVALALLVTTLIMMRDRNGDQYWRKAGQGIGRPPLLVVVLRQARYLRGAASGPGQAAVTPSDIPPDTHRIPNLVGGCNYPLAKPLARRKPWRCVHPPLRPCPPGGCPPI